jgi:hypothetical protein
MEESSEDKKKGLYAGETKLGGSWRTFDLSEIKISTPRKLGDIVEPFDKPTSHSWLRGTLLHIAKQTCTESDPWNTPNESHACHSMFSFFDNNFQYLAECVSLFLFYFILFYFIDFSFSFK